MHKKCIAVTIVAVIIVGAVAFYGGMQYSKSKSASQQVASRNGGGQFQGQGQGGGNKQSGGQRMGGGNGNQGDLAVGDILSKDEKSITVKMKDGGSKIIYFSDSTTIGKTAEGSAADLNVGQQVMVSGKGSSDGSLTAQNIQIRPADQNQPGQ